MALAFVRQVKAFPSWQHCFVSSYVVESCLISNQTSEIVYITPLYLYPDLDSLEPRPNLNPRLVTGLEETYKGSFNPERLFYYIYAVLFAPSYREKYEVLLRSGFPRIPFPIRREIFEAIAEFGRRLVALHLLFSPELDSPLTRFEGQGDSQVEKGKKDGLRYDAKAECVYINPTQYFKPVPKEAWDYAVGAYQVCAKWLKDRKGRKISLEDIKHYCKIVTALEKTIAIQKEINDLYREVEKSIIEF